MFFVYGECTKWTFSPIWKTLLIHSIEISLNQSQLFEQELTTVQEVDEEVKSVEEVSQ